MEIDKIVSLAQSSQSVISRRIVKSVMTPIVLVCLASPCCFLAAYLLRDDTFLSRILGIVGVLPIVVACGMYVYFGIFKPDKPQSEDFQIRRELLQIISSKSGKINVAPVSVEVITSTDGKAVIEEDK